MDRLGAVRELLTAFNERRLADTVKYFDEHIVWDISRPGAPDLGVYYGAKAAAEFWRSWLPQWSEIHSEIAWIAERGERVVVWIHQKQRGKESGVDLEIEYAYEYIFRDDKIIRATLITDEDEARRAVA